MSSTPTLSAVRLHAISTPPLMYLGGNHHNHSGGYAIIADLYEVFKSL